MISRVLTVCTGNICRSPLAEARLQRDAAHLSVESAGIGALVGQPADPHALSVAERHGLDVSQHRARQINELLVHGNDLILVMEPGHAQWIMGYYPQTHGRIFLLGHWHDQQMVADPYRQELASFETAFHDIEKFSRAWLERLAA